MSTSLETSAIERLTFEESIALVEESWGQGTHNEEAQAANRA